MLFTMTKQEQPNFVFGFKTHSTLQYDVLNLIIIAIYLWKFPFRSIRKKAFT